MPSIGVLNGLVLEATRGTIDTLSVSSPPPLHGQLCFYQSKLGLLASSSPSLSSATLGWAPSWYSTYRFVLTFIVGASIVLSLIGRGQIADKVSKAPGPADRMRALREGQAAALEKEEEERRNRIAEEDEEEEGDEEDSDDEE